MWETLAGLVVATAVSGVVPLVNAELLVVAAAAAMPAFGVPLVALASAVGQMTAKTSMFAVARWAPSRLPEKAKTALGRTGEAVARRSGAVGSLVFTSAVTGVPPFYGVSLASGAVGVRLRTFVAGGLAGRFVRFVALAWMGRRFGSEALQTLAVTPVAAFLGGSS